MAAAGRVKFGRFAATQRAVWIAFAYFASLGNERICYAAVERNDDDVERPAGGRIAERAKVSGRTVRRHIPALIDRGLIQSDNRKGGHYPSTWKVVLPAADVLVGLTSVSPDVRGGQNVRAGRTRCPTI